MTKHILITGSTDGIGKLAALKLAQDGHNLYLHGRKPDKLAAVIAELQASTSNPNISGFVADFANLEAVRAMAAQVQQEVAQLDILINNAGVYKSPIDTTAAGLDIRFAVNYFAPYVLTQALLPLLKQSQAPRIINLSSAAQAPVSLSALTGQAQLPTPTAYAQSKLALTMWSTHLAAQESTAIVIAVNPGSLLNTNMVREGFGYHRSSADKGGDILYELAVSDKYAQSSGQYFDNDLGNFGTVHPAGQRQATIAELIAETERYLA